MSELKIPKLKESVKEIDMLNSMRTGLCTRAHVRSCSTIACDDCILSSSNSELTVEEIKKGLQRFIMQDHTEECK